MAEILTPDLCVIGGGAGGVAAALEAAGLGATVVVVERGEMGGTTLNYGSIPSKALIAAGRHAQAMRDGAALGVGGSEPKVDYGKLYDHIHQTINAVAPLMAAERLAAKGVTVLRAAAEFVDAKTVKAGEQTIEARRFVIATGSRPALPPIPGIDAVKVITNETLFDETHKPGRMIVIGADAVGLELAQAHHRLGSTVVVVDPGPALMREDPELAEVVLRRLRAEGLEIREHTSVGEIAARGHGVAVTIDKDGETETLNGSHLVIAATRVPATGGLNLDKARIAFSPAGIKIDRRYKTSNRRVYAIGEVAGAPHYAYLAQHQGRVVARHAVLGFADAAGEEAIPFAVFTDPEIATVGATDTRGGRRRAQGLRVVRQSLAENDRALTTRSSEGLVKVVFDGKGRIRGASIVGPHAGELIGLYAFAIANRLGARHLERFVAPYPTLVETARQIAVTLNAGKDPDPWLTRLAALVRRLP